MKKTAVQSSGELTALSWSLANCWFSTVYNCRGRRQDLEPHEVVGLTDVGRRERVVALSLVERGGLDQARCRSGD